MNKKELLKLFLDNRARAIELKHGDKRAYFESLYNCFENLGELITDKNSGEIISSLKNRSDNSMARAFYNLYYNKVGGFKDNLLRLKEYSPIQNNTNNRLIVITKIDFTIFLDVLYSVRNNVRHGKKEFTERSEDILDILNTSLYYLIEDTIEIYNNRRDYEEWFKTIVREDIKKYPRFSGSGVVQIFFKMLFHLFKLFR